MRNHQNLVNDYSQNFNTNNTQLPFDKTLEYGNSTALSPSD